MNTYRRSLFKSTTCKVEILPLIFLLYILSMYYENLAFWEWGGRECLIFFILVILALPSIYSVVSLLFYIELYEDRVVLVNGIFKSWSKTYTFHQYPYCRIEYNNGYLVNIIKMRKNNIDKFFPCYGIDLVDPKDLKEIISILESKGVTVITKDLKDI